LPCQFLQHSSDPTSIILKCIPFQTTAPEGFFAKKCPFLANSPGRNSVCGEKRGSFKTYTF
jgi:hypothetical protein